MSNKRTAGPARPELREVAVAELRPNPWNPNVVPEHRLQALARTVRRDGQLLSVPLVRPVEGGYEIVDGEHRWEAAKAAGVERMTVLVVEASDQEARARTVAMNQIHGEPDPARQAALLAELARNEAEAVAALAGEPDIPLREALGFDEREWARVIGLQADLAGDGFDLEAAMAGSAGQALLERVKPGQIWRLHEHRLMCGDATKKADVRALLHGAKPRLMVTDPPYGVSYDPEWRKEAKPGRLRWQPRSLDYMAVANDDVVDWREAWQHFPGDVCYVWHAGIHTLQVAAGLEACAFEIRAQIIWVKPVMVISRGHYSWRHEPCFYAVRSGAQAAWIGGPEENTVWEILRDKPGPGAHATQKPLEAMGHPIRNHEGDVYDPFVGSGTTLIAAERLGRTCWAMDIEPRWCSATIARWEAETGESAVLAEE
jgi:DNA modification methylase